MRVLELEKAASLPPEWDQKCEDYFQKRKFLSYCEQYNPCNQKYYCLYEKERFIAGCVRYRLKVNFLTFLGGSLNIGTNIIGIPVSVSSSGIIGEKGKLIDKILNKEKGLVLIMNEGRDLTQKAIRIESLPTIIFENRFKDIEDYTDQMRKSYRRRMKKAQNKKIRMKKDRFKKEHYLYYLHIIDKTKTKLETLSYDFFANLPKEFVLSASKKNDQMMAWNITLRDKEKLYFFFGGLNYQLNNKYSAYINNLYGIIFEGIRKKCKIIELGQTAEIAKIRMGGKPVRKYIYLNHSNAFCKLFISICKRGIEYKKTIPKYGVFRNENSNG